MPTRTHVCPEPGCPNLQPCGIHGRQPGQAWTTRDYGAQTRFRKLIFARSLGHCERCGARATVAHHVKPGYEPECGLALCDECHMTLDSKARPTR